MEERTITVSSISTSRKFRRQFDLQSKSCRLPGRSATASRTRFRDLLSTLNDYIDWPFVQQVFKVERRFTYGNSGNLHHEIQFGLTSLKAKQTPPEELLKIVRSEWGIENGLHYRRDVTFLEDKTRMSRKAMARAMTCINNLVIALFCQQGFSNHAHARRIFDANPMTALSLICRL